ncbi:MAG TPA: hypothetical protein DD658_06280 [Deltaproteobacteria bacterium]|nr:hypothetical protein [Deltaproteobacteria bacterium]
MPLSPVISNEMSVLATWSTIACTLFIRSLKENRSLYSSSARTLVLRSASSHLAWVASRTISILRRSSSPRNGFLM